MARRVREAKIKFTLLFFPAAYIHLCKPTPSKPAPFLYSDKFAKSSTPVLLYTLKTRKPLYIRKGYNMLRRVLTFWMVDDHDGTYPKTLDNLVRSIRNTRNTLGLSESKTLGTEHSHCLTPTTRYLEHQAYLVGYKITYKAHGEVVPSANAIAWAIRDKARALFLDDGEVISAAGLIPRTAQPYMRGRLPKVINLYYLAVLAETIDISVAYELEHVEPSATGNPHNPLHS